MSAVKEFERAVHRYISELRAQNLECEKTGDFHTIQCNCNQLKGIDFVMNEFKKL